MLQDPVLAWLILSTFLGSLVFGTFAESVIGVILPVNAAVVVLLQYNVGKHLSAHNLKRLMSLGTLFFVLGLSVFMMAKSNLYIWALGAFLFTLGELIYAPG